MPLMLRPNWPQRDKNRAVPVSCAKDDCLLDKYTQRASLSYPGNKTQPDYRDRYFRIPMVQRYKTWLMRTLDWSID